jgi:hypothetical protein
MIFNKYYKVITRIKLHTSLLRELEYEREGLLVRESKSYLWFRDFRVKKATVVSITPIGEGDGE